MDQVSKLKQWVNENAPMLANIYENKYVGMAHDRFASLPPRQQKQLLVGVFSGAVFIVFLYLLFAYLSLWSFSSKTRESASMTNLLLQYQKSRRDKSQQIKFLARNSQLSAPGQFKQHLMDIGRTSSISPRMMKIEEKGEVGTKEDDSKGAQSEVKIKTASVTLEKVTLTQLTAFLKNIEYGQFNLQVSSIKISNDSKTRGYMTVELGLVAHLFETEEG